MPNTNSMIDQTISNAVALAQKTGVAPVLDLASVGRLKQELIDLQQRQNLSTEERLLGLESIAVLALDALTQMTELALLGQRSSELNHENFVRLSDRLERLENAVIGS